MDGFQNTYFTQHLLSAHFKYLQLPNKSLTLSKVSCTASAAAAAVPSTNRDKNCYPLCLHQAFYAAVLCVCSIMMEMNDGVGGTSSGRRTVATQQCIRVVSQINLLTVNFLIRGQFD